MNESAEKTEKQAQSEKEPIAADQSNWFFGGDTDWDRADTTPTGKSVATDDEPKQRSPNV